MPGGVSLMSSKGGNVRGAAPEGWKEWAKNRGWVSIGDKDTVLFHGKLAL